MSKDPLDDVKSVRLVVKLVGVVTILCVLALLYEAIETGKDIAIAGATNIAMIGIGAMAAILGYEKGGG